MKGEYPMKKYEDYPDLLLVSDLMEILNSCYNTTRALLHQTKAFPVIKHGGKLMVPKKPFWDALMTGKIR
jgi:hypothetical protein